MSMPSGGIPPKTRMRVLPTSAAKSISFLVVSMLSRSSAGSAIAYFRDVATHAHSMPESWKNSLISARLAALASTSTPWLCLASALGSTPSYAYFRAYPTNSSKVASGHEKLM